MRVALVSQEYPPDTAKGGLGTQTFVKAHGLAALGHEVHVISRAANGTSGSEVDDRVVRVRRLPGPGARMPIFTEAADWLAYSAEVAAAIAGLHARHPLDIVDVPEWGGEGYIHLINRTEWNDIPTVLQVHGPLAMLAETVGWPPIDSEFYRVGTMMEGTCLRLADAVYASSTWSAQWCAQHYGIDRSRVSTLHAGVDTSLFSPRRLPKAARPTIVCVGRVTPAKGVDLLVDAVCRLRAEIPNVRLRLLGRVEAPTLRNLQARTRECPELLEIAGFVAREDLARELVSAHVFAAPSLCEGGPGFACLEAMACGLPVVACDQTGVAGIVRHEETGLLVPPRDVLALVAALRRLLADPLEREALGARGRALVLDEHDSVRSIRRIEAFYAGVVAARPAGAARR